MKRSENEGAKARAGFRFPRISFGRADVIGEKMRSGVTAATVGKYAVYAVLSLFLILVRTTFFARFRPFGAAPDILIVAVAAIGMFEGERAGAIFGAVIGFIADALGGSGIILLPLPYMLVGYFCGVIATEYYRRSVLLFLIFDAASAVVRLFTSLFYMFLVWHSVDLSVVFGGVLLPELCSTLAVSPVPALILLPVYLIFRKKKKELD